MADVNSRVKFCYVRQIEDKPNPADANTVYFIEDAQQIHVGDKVIAKSSSGESPTIIVNGDVDGNYVSNATYDAQTNTLTITKSTADTVVTENSSNLVTSGAVYTAVAAAAPTWTVIE